MSTPALPQLLSLPPVVRRVSRDGNLLRRGPFRDRPYIWALDIAHGCSHGCAFCPISRLESSGPESAIQLADGLAERLKNQLSGMRPRPETVLLGLDTDPFMPSPIVQAEVVKAIRVLSDFRITAWAATRGNPLPAVLDALESHRNHIRITVSLATTDEAIQRVLEPKAASLETRLQLIADLQSRGIPYEVNVEPLLPGVTDTREKLRELLEALAALSVRQITAGYLVLRGAVQENMRAALHEAGWVEVMLAAYQDGPILRDGADRSQFLSKSKRQRGYAALMSLAAAFDIEVRVGRLSNPDFNPPRRPNAAHAAEIHHMIQSFRRSMSASA